MPDDWDEHMRSGEEIGPGQFIRREYRHPDGRRITYPKSAEPVSDGVFIGLTENHTKPDGSWCGGWIAFKNVEGADEKARHELVSADPLTVSPSLGCRQCPNHGFIREGKWVNA